MRVISINFYMQAQHIIQFINMGYNPQKIKIAQYYNLRCYLDAVFVNILIYKN